MVEAIEQVNSELLVEWNGFHDKGGRFSTSHRDTGVASELRTVRSAKRPYKDPLRRARERAHIKKALQKFRSRQA